MPNWFKDKKDDLPPELKDKTPEQVVASLNELNEVKAKLASIEANRADEVKNNEQMKSSFDQMKNRIQELEASARPRPQPQQQEPPDWTLDPQKAFDHNAAPIAAVAVNSAAMTARLIAQQNLDNKDIENKTNDGRLFRFWEAEINEIAKRYQATQLTQPDAWIGIYMYVKGNHADELSDPESRKKKYNFLESGKTGAPPPPQGDKPAPDQLTAEELRVASRMNVSPENYLKRKKAMQFVQ